MGLGVGPSPDPDRAISVDRFDENRVGLDHLNFSIDSREELDRAARLYILAFRDPDNIQLELSAPHGSAA